MAFPKFLRVASLSKFRTLEINKNFTNEDIYNNVQGKLIELLSSKLNFSYETVSPEDGEYGRLLPGGEWSGMVGMIERGEADVIIHYLGMSEERTSAIDFSTPYSLDYFTFATILPEYTADITAFALPFSYEVWYCILFYVVMKIVTIFFLRHLCYEFGISRFSLKKPRNIGERLFAASYSAADMFLRYFYAAVLLAFLTFPTQTGVRTVGELSRAVLRGTHQCATFEGSYILNYFRSSNDSDLNTIGQSLSRYITPLDVEETLEMSNSGQKFAFLSFESHLVPLNFKYFVSKETLLLCMTAIGLRNDFCCKSVLDSLIGHIWASGIYGKFVDDAAFKMTLRNYKNHSFEVKNHRSLAIEDFEGVFVLFIAGHALALLVLVFEIIIFKTEVRASKVASKFHYYIKVTRCEKFELN